MCVYVMSVVDALLTSSLDSKPFAIRSQEASIDALVSGSTRRGSIRWYPCTNTMPSSVGIKVRPAPKVT